MSPRLLWSMVVLLLTINRIKLLRMYRIIALTKNRCLLLLILVVTVASGVLKHMMSPKGTWYSAGFKWYGYIFNLILGLMNLVINIFNIGTIVYIVYKTREMRTALPYRARKQINRGNKVLFGFLAACIADSIADMYMQCIRAVTLNGYLNIKYLLDTMKGPGFCEFLIIYDGFADLIVTIITALILQFTPKMRSELSAMINAVKRCRNLFKEPGIPETREEDSNTVNLLPNTE